VELENTAYLLQKSGQSYQLDFRKKCLIKQNEELRRTSGIQKQTVDWNVENDYADLITSSLVLEHIKI
jgi:hypothetical protein